MATRNATNRSLYFVRDAGVANTSNFRFREAPNAPILHAQREPDPPCDIFVQIIEATLCVCENQNEKDVTSNKKISKITGRHGLLRALACAPSGLSLRVAAPPTTELGLRVGPSTSTFFFTMASSAGSSHQDNASLNPMIVSIAAARYSSGIIFTSLL